MSDTNKYDWKKVKDWKFPYKGLNDPKNIKELFDGINNILSNENIKNSLDDARKQFNYDFNFLHDGDASTRIFKFLTNS